MKTWVIYALLKNDMPFYVGVSSNPERRMREHKKIFGYKPAYKILELGIGDGRFIAEHYWIEKFRADGIILENQTVGGNGGQTHGACTRALLSKIGKGKSKPRGFGEKIRKALKGHPCYSEIDSSRRAKIGEASRARWAKLTSEQKSALGKKTAEGRKRNHTTRELSEIYRKSSKLAREKPGDRQIISNRFKNWWAGMSKEEKDDFIARRSAKKRERKTESS